MKQGLTLAALAALSLICAGLAGAAESSGWVKQPNQNDIDTVFPKSALAAHVNGKATLHCTVTVEGLLSDCTVSDETPKGYNFGAAALALAPDFKAPPSASPRAVTIVQGFQVEGGTNYSDDMRATLRAQGVDIDKLIIGLNDEDQDTLNMLRDQGIDPDQMRMSLGLAPKSRTDQSTVRLWSNPIWLQAPTQADLVAAWPKLSDAKEGTATIQCLVQDNGTLKGCQIVNEQPHGQSIGTSAIKLANLFKANTAAGPGGGLAVQLVIHMAKPGATPSPTPQINQPTWTATPNAAAIAAAFPDEAKAAGIGRGVGQMRCTVAQGTLTACTATGSSSPVARFGQAALRLAGLYRINPWIQGVGPTDGASVLVTVTFSDGSPAPPIPMPRAGGPPAAPRPVP